MKTRLFLTVAIALIMASNLYSSNPLILTNISKSELSTVKEVTIFDEYSELPSRRILYIYDSQGAIQERKVYEWNVFKGWEDTQMLRYEYDNASSMKLKSVTLSKWDKKKDKWLSTTETVAYNEDSQGAVYVAQTKNK